MREHKFRAWEKKMEEMIPVYSVSFDRRAINLSEDSQSFHEIELMQYTGLKDKNGKDIYEGDILTTDLSRPYLVVEFRNGAFMCQCHDSGKDYYDFMAPDDENSNFTKYHEVIGNIYENKELLEEVI